MEFEPVTTPKYIQIDLYPAHTVKTHPETHETSLVTNQARIIVTDEHFYLLQETTTGFEATVVAPITEFDGQTSLGYDATLEDGTVYHFHRAAGCACGSRMKSYHIFPGIPYNSPERQAKNAAKKKN